MSMIDNLLFGKRENYPHVQRPEHCDKTCIRFRSCNFPKSCYVRQKDLADRKEESEKRILD